MKKLLALGVLLCAIVAQGQMVKEITIINGTNTWRTAVGNTNTVFTPVVGPLGDLFTLVTNTVFQYTNYPGRQITNKTIMAPVTPVVWLWRATSGDNNSASTLTWQKSYNGVNWEAGGTVSLTAGTNGVWTYASSSVDVAQYGYLRISNITNASNAGAYLTNDVRLYYKANN